MHEKHDCCNGNVCCICRKQLKGEELIPRMDPYNSELNDDYTEHLFCEKCYEMSCDEI